MQSHEAKIDSIDFDTEPANVHQMHSCISTAQQEPPHHCSTTAFVLPKSWLQVRRHPISWPHTTVNFSELVAQPPSLNEIVTTHYPRKVPCPPGGALHPGQKQQGS
jgi:hypothetical protein